MRRLAVLVVPFVLTACGGQGAEPPPAATSSAPHPARIVPVPSAIGLPVSIAAARLRAVGLRVAVAQVDSPLADGSVLRQTPAAGHRRRQGTAVRLVVARQVSEARPNQVVVPSVVGLRRGVAVAQLGASELRARFVRVEARARAGAVVGQLPPPGTRLLRSSVVTLRVSR